ncbi:hypothetical protein HMPREF3145_00220 [Corynebacterium sp. HMSC05C01]|uniref:hypothetical protein n=1 Tax=Corynebacterium TaxID=1716 RepID=UPI0008A3AB79|nr:MULTISPECIES: hypothetical protein [Corynebacterium]OFL91704.1 hypothetical protein HMPREF2734_10610 [Corynebacterium sp. HMSC055D05]OFO33272.1 hypothetical protein HMPREF3048_10850 [Corynebacterium sp. HMSC075D04]OFT73258.1 hypothetical protein HMPREF3145_00220 [Corynebacterium sp. HMSC05C01]PLA37385.1 hypothetical protein CYJ46_09285 [Corynebacterium coyleae]
MYKARLSTAVAVALLLCSPAVAEGQTAEEDTFTEISSTDDGSPATQATRAIALAMAFTGLGFALSALIQGAASILGIKPPQLPQLVR